MNFSGKSFVNKKKYAWLKILLIPTILFGLIFALNAFSYQIKNSFYAFSSPIQDVVSNTGKSSSNWIGSFLNATNLSKENYNLKNENQKLLATLSILQSIQEGNQALSAISETCQDKNFTTIMAGITGLNNEDILTINKGSEDGIKEGMPVIDQYNVLYGKIFKVYKNFSQVMLISNKNSVVNVQTQKIISKEIESNIDTDDKTSTENIEENAEKIIFEAEKNVNGIVKGAGGLSIFLDLVPVDDKINNGEILITSCIDQNFPKDILVGRIIEIQKNDQKPFQQAQISPFFNLKSVKNLFVITDYKKDI
jgi:rod shape-determining protein MreC